MRLFTARKDGTFDNNVAPDTGIPLRAMSKLVADPGGEISDPVGFFDLEAQRYVLFWITFANPEALAWVATSASSDPTGDWTITALKFNLQGVACNDSKALWDYPQVRCR